MGLYIYANPKDGEEVVEVFQGMNDVHEYYQDGIKWNRVFTVPTASVDGKVDAFSQKSFLNKTKNVKTYGEAWKISKEFSEARTEKEGAKDVITQRAEKQFFDKKGKK